MLCWSSDRQIWVLKARSGIVPARRLGPIVDFPPHGKGATAIKAPRAYQPSRRFPSATQDGDTALQLAPWIWCPTVRRPAVPVLVIGRVCFAHWGEPREARNVPRYSTEKTVCCRGRQRKDPFVLWKRMIEMTISALMLIAFTRCSGTSSKDPTGGPGGSGGAGTATDDPYCSRFGLRYAATCDGCPAEPLACPCAGQGADLGIAGSFQRCNFGRCLLAVDCTEICRATSAFVTDVLQGSAIPPDLMEAITRIPSCVKDRSCQVDSGCGAAGKCVGESASQSGKCTAGDAVCLGPSDCWSGICVATGAAGAGGSSAAGDGGGTSGAGAATGTSVSSKDGYCRDGMPGSYCSDDSHCPGGKCLVGFNSVCTRGNAGDPCMQADDCVSGTFCVRAPMDGDFGACRAGNPDDPCFQDAQCKSGACIDGRCGSG